MLLTRVTHLLAILTAAGLLLIGAAPQAVAATPAVGAPAAAPTGSGAEVWKSYDITITRGSWQTLATHTIPAGSKWTVSLQLTLDLDSATGSQIRGQNTSIGWARKGWGGESVGGADDLTGASDNAIAVHNDASYQHLAQHTLAGGGPLAWRVKVGGTGRVTATMVVFKAIKGTPAGGCPPLIPACLAADIGMGVVDQALGAVGGMVESAAESMLAVVATGFLEAYLMIFKWATTWWLSLSMSPQALVGAVDADFRATISYIAMVILVLALLSAAIQTMWRRDGSVVADTAAGLFKAVLVIFGSWAVLGVLWTLADQLTMALAPDPGNIDVDPVAGLASTIAGPGLAVLVIIISAIGFVVSLGMALMMIFRLASTVVLALLLPIAAAGAPGTSTRAWLPKVGGWLLALVFLRPMVAAIYRIGFEFVAGGNDPANADLVTQMGRAGEPGAIPDAAADGLMTMLVGVMTLLVAMFALPVLLRLFSWMFGSVAGVGGAGLAMASMGAQGALLSRRSGGAAQHAERMAADLSQGGAGPTPTGGAPTGGGSGPTPGAMPAPGGHTPSSGPVAGGAAAGGGSAASGAAAAGGAGAAAGGAGAAAGSAGAGAAAGAVGGPPGMLAGAAVVGGVMQLAGALRGAGEKAGHSAEGAIQ
jgi:hypothetical protein